MFKILRDLSMAISAGSSPVRLSLAKVRFTSLFNNPISGGIEPGRCLNDKLSDTTRELSSHVTPEKKQ
jgi:hypothetical protein